MATYSTATNQLAALKELYVDNQDFMVDLVYRKNPLLALVPKDESPSGLAGKYIPCPVVYGTGQGRSADFGTSQTNQTAPLDVSYFVYRVKNYQTVSITNELLEATKNDAGAFIDAAKLAMDTGIRNLTNDIALGLFSDGSGARGQISAISSGVITLTNVTDVVNFEVNMTLVSYSVSGTTPTQSTAAALGYVIAVNRTAGTVTVAASGIGGSAATPTNWSTTFKYLAVQGDITFASGSLAISSSGALKLAGLQAWLPTTAPTAGDSFWGVDRSADPTRLGGVRFDGSSEQIEEALIDASALVAREGGQPEMCFMNFASYAALIKGLGSKVQYVDVEHNSAKIAFKGVQVIGDYGPINVVPDRSCPAQTAYLLTMDSWKLRTLNKCPHILTYGMEGLDGIRVYNSDALEVRLGMYGNLICNAPGYNCVVQLSQ